jgi:nucleoside-diphosphate-sugar epimerase
MYKWYYISTNIISSPMHLILDQGIIISLLEENLWTKAIKNYMPLQDWDVLETSADIDYTKEKLWWEPKFNIEDWVKNFSEWFKDFYFTINTND